MIIASNKRVIHFGYQEHAGHFLQGGEGPGGWNPPPGFPWNFNFIDGGLLENRKVPDYPDGRVHWTCGGKPVWIAFFWWDRSGDKRGASNSGFYVQGFDPRIKADRQAALDYACEQWPKVAARQHFSLRLEDFPE